jgi:uncharacterized protein
MDHQLRKYYPSILQAIHLVILYIFIQTLIDFPLALIDYFKDTEYLYHPVKKIVVGIGSNLFILLYGIYRAKAPFNKIFPVKFFNPLILIPVALFFWGGHNILDEANIVVEKFIPAPPWFWELFNKIFESDYGWWGAFVKVSVIAPIVEESIFRGLILHGLKKNYSAATSIFISALLFSLFHLNPWQIPATFVLGLLLGWIMIRTNNILLAIIIHSLNNFMVLMNIKYWQEINTHSIYLMPTANKLMLSLFVLLLSLILIYWLTITKKSKRKKTVKN